MVGGSSRYRFQSPEPRHPSTPPRKTGPILRRTETPVLVPPLDRPSLEWSGHGARENPKGQPRAGFRKSKDKKKTARRKAAAEARKRAAAKVPGAPKKPPPDAIWLDDTDTDDDSMAATAGESESEAKDEESEPDDSDTSSEYGMDPLAFGPGRAEEAYQHMRRQHYLHRVRRDPQAFLAARARQKKARQDQKRQRLAARHGHNQKIRTHTPFVPKLQVSQQGPGQFKVRSTGLSPAIRKQVKTLLGRIKGKLFINGKFTSLKRAFSVIMALLTKKQVIQVQVK